MLQVSSRSTKAMPDAAKATFIQAYKLAHWRNSSMLLTLNRNP
jgi:hypothetical protein